MFYFLPFTVVLSFEENKLKDVVMDIISCTFNQKKIFLLFFFFLDSKRQSINWIWNKEAIIKRTMGSVISKGRRYSPKKRDPNKQASTSSVEHDKFASGDTQVQSNEA